jgi:hypothetical protein
MATRGTPIPGETVRLIVGLRALNYSLRTIARHAGVSVPTVRKYLATAEQVLHTPARGRV